MKNFFALALYLLPIAAVTAYWLELTLTDQVTPERLPLFVVVVVAFVCWLNKDTVWAQTFRPILMGIFFGSVSAIMLAGPALTTIERERELESIKNSDPGMHEFITHSTAINPLHEYHRRRGLKIAIPVSCAIGALLGSAPLLYRRRLAIS